MRVCGIRSDNVGDLAEVICRKGALLTYHPEILGVCVWASSYSGGSPGGVPEERSVSDSDPSASFPCVIIPDSFSFSTDLPYCGVYNSRYFGAKSDRSRKVEKAG